MKQADDYKKKMVGEDDLKGGRGVLSEFVCHVFQDVAMTWEP